ncbi:MAG: hypothetical protein ACYC7L_17880 [Nitrospirota bacterium]
MNVSQFAAVAALVLLSSGHVHAGQAGAPAAAQGEGKALQAEQAGSANKAATAPSGSSVVERDKKRYENQKRAAERRAAEMKKAERAKKSAASGSSVAERDKKRYENQKRAAEKRAAEMKKAEKSTRVKEGAPAGAQEQTPATK